MKKASICLVTPGYIASTPRVVKEADALHAAGYRVRVVFTEGDLALLREHDRSLLLDKPWQWTSLRWSRQRRGERSVYWAASLRYHVARRTPSIFWHICSLAEHAEGRLYSELARAAAAEPADLFIGHYPTGLAAAAWAASSQGSRLGYDAEDLHTAEDVSTRAAAVRRRRIDGIERRYLPRCAHVTAAAPRIADALADRYAIPRPVVLHNVFPFSDRERLDGKILDRQGPALSLCWVSQTIGLDRGIADVVRAAGLLRAPVQIHIRGVAADSVKADLLALARNSGSGVAEHLHIHPPAAPTDLLSRIAEHDVGLALEQGHVTSYSLTVTNKLFLSLLAGLAIVATDVPGQRDVLASSDGAGILYRPGDSAALASHLDHWLSNPDRLTACRAAALVAARNRWNWELESEALLDSVAAALA